MIGRISTGSTQNDPVDAIRTDEILSELRDEANKITHARATRDQLILEAHHLRPASVTIKEIADAAGISRQQLYNIVNRAGPGGR